MHFPSTRKPRLRRTLLVLFLGLAAAGGAAMAMLAHWQRPREVIAGVLYRSAQLAPDELADFVTRQGIRSVISLRKQNADDPDFVAELAWCRANGVPNVQVPFSPMQLPSAVAARDLVEALEQAPRPVLVHCHQGVDRTGLACTLYLAIFEGEDVARARTEQLSLRTGHFAWGQAHAMYDFFDLYLSSAPDRDLRSWIEEDYPALAASNR